MFPQRPINSYVQQLQIRSRHQNPNKIRQQLREYGGDIRKTSCYPAYIPIPFTAGSGMSLALRHSWKTHAYPGSSIFHPCYGNIDIGRQAADIGYVMMQLKQEPFYYYWQECVSPPPSAPPSLPFQEANMIWKQCREIQREPTRNKRIHLVISMSFFGSSVNAVYQRGRTVLFCRGSHIYINLSCMRQSTFSSNHKVQHHNSPCNKPLSRVLCFA